MSDYKLTKYESNIKQLAKEGKLDGVDVYLAHYLFNTPLTTKQQEMYSRYRYVSRVRAEGWNKRHIIKKLVEGDPDQGFSRCSERTARDAYAQAFQVFGDYDKQDKTLERNLKIEWYENRAMAVMEDADAGLLDYDKAHDLSKKYQDMAVKLRGLLEEDKDWVDPHAWETQEFFFVSADASILDVEHEDVTDKEGGNDEQ